MLDDFIELVYLNVIGELIPQACIPGVEDLFEEGKPCHLLMSELYEATAHLHERLGVVDEDADIDTVVDTMFSVCAIVGRAMYHYGAKFGERKPGPHDALYDF